MDTNLTEKFTIFLAGLEMVMAMVHLYFKINKFDLTYSDKDAL